MITIPASNLESISDFGLLTILSTPQRYSKSTLKEAAFLLESGYGTTNLRWDGKDIVVVAGLCPSVPVYL